MVPIRSSTFFSMLPVRMRNGVIMTSAHEVKSTLCQKISMLVPLSSSVLQTKIVTNPMRPALNSTGPRQIRILAKVNHAFQLSTVERTKETKTILLTWVWSLLAHQYATSLVRRLMSLLL